MPLECCVVRGWSHSHAALLNLCAPVAEEKRRSEEASTALQRSMESDRSAAEVSHREALTKAEAAVALHQTRAAEVRACVATLRVPPTTPPVHVRSQRRLSQTPERTLSLFPGICVTNHPFPSCAVVLLLCCCCVAVVQVEAELSRVQRSLHFQEGAWLAERDSLTQGA